MRHPLFGVTQDLKSRTFRLQTTEYVKNDLAELDGNKGFFMKNLPLDFMF